MNSKHHEPDILLLDYIEAHVDDLLQDEGYYAALATPIKSAEVIKKQHRSELVEFLQMKDLASCLENAENLIRDHLPELISPEAFEKVRNEFDHSIEHMFEMTERLAKEGNKPVLLQELFGFSNDSLVQIYGLAEHLIKRKHYEDAVQILTFLTTLTPDIPSFWITFGICLQLLKEHEGAIALFDIVKMLKPTDPVPFIYSAESYMALNHFDKAKQELESAKPLLNGVEKGPWQISLEFVTQKLKG